MGRRHQSRRQVCEARLEEGKHVPCMLVERNTNMHSRHGWASEPSVCGHDHSQHASTQRHSSGLAIMNDAATVETRRQSELEAKRRQLERFQRSVRDRVGAQERARQRVMLDESEKAVASHRRVFQHSAFQDKLRRNPTTLAAEAQQTVAHPPSKHSRASEPAAAVEVLANQRHTAAQHARQGLVTRKLSSAKATELPGGVWSHNEAVQLLQNELEQRQIQHQHQSSGDDDADSDQCSKSDDKDIYDQTNTGPEECPGNKQSQHATTADAHLLNAPTVFESAFRSQGQLAEERKRQERSQFSMYRRMYADEERARVRAYQRRKQHADKIKRLKLQKESDRALLETHHAMEALSVAHPAVLPQKQHHHHQHTAATKHTTKQGSAAKQQARYEWERRMDVAWNKALRLCKARHIDLPPLCACGPTVWHLDRTADSCAINCRLRNRRVKAKELTALLGALSLL
eukprot:m.122290 g.122290  ORF g.122290 m.122290 type:complete len:460 (+) comp16557_c1_seq1:2107-3486(+)